MKYVLLAYVGKRQRAMTEVEQNAMFDECFEYDEHLRADRLFDAEAALQPPATGLTLHWKNGKVATTDGPYAETKELLGGIGIFEARDLNHAAQLLAQHPALKYGTVLEIRPTVDMDELREASKKRRQNPAR